MLKSALFSLALAAFVSGQGFTISTIAGNHTVGNYGNPAPALAAQFDSPQSVAVDKAGNVYIADWFNNMVREVTPNGMIQTFAGTGTRGYSGDGGPAVNAQLSFPMGIAFDSTGSLYIADSSNNVIRKVTPDGNIATVAGIGTPGNAGDGGSPTAAQLYNPYAVVVDAAGDLYISDSNNHKIREVVASTGIIATLGGNGVPGYAGDGAYVGGAQFNYPKGLAIDAAGNVYVADFGNSVIRKIAVNSDIVTTVAGTSTPGFAGDGGPAVMAQLAYPEGLTVDAAGNLYIADSQNQRVRVVSAAGIITTIAGTGVAGYSGDGGPAIDAQLFYPKGVALSGTGSIYIADWDNNLVRLLTPAATPQERPHHSPGR